MQNLFNSTDRCVFQACAELFAAQQLRHTNKALSEFGHAVSHDLKAPLRHIVTYADLLQQIYAPQLDAKGMKFIRRLSVNAARATFFFTLPKP